MSQLTAALAFLGSTALAGSALAQSGPIKVVNCAKVAPLATTAAVVVRPVRTSQDGNVPAGKARLNVSLDVPSDIVEEVLRLWREGKIELTKDGHPLTDKDGHPLSFGPIERKRGQYTATVDVDIGRYELRASEKLTEEHPELWNMPPLQIRLDEHGVYEVTVHLPNGKAIADYYRMGKGLVPFKASNTLVVTFNLGFIPSKETVDRVKSTAETFGVKLTSKVEVDKDPGRYNATLRFTLPDGVDVVEVLARFRGIVDAQKGRVGIAIDEQGDYFRVLGNRYVVHLSPEAVKDKDWRDGALDAAGLVKIKGYPDAPELLIMEFKSGDYKMHFATINCLVDSGVVLTAEPDLIGKFTPHGMRDDWPNNTRYKDQMKGNHGYQQVRDAWKLLYDDRTKLIGKPAIRIGLVDEAINPKDEELDCPDGPKAIAFCWDPLRIAAGDVPEEGNCAADPVPASHGMAMAGVMAACANNGKQVAGIAPHVGINAVRFDMSPYYADYETSAYADLLLWMGGRPLECPANAGPQDICNYPKGISSDVINNSYGIGVPPRWNETKIELPLVVSTAFKLLTTHGRPGKDGKTAKGTILVYAAGQSTTPTRASPAGGADIAIREPMAADSRVIAVSNCFMSPEGRERLYRGRADGLNAHSNYGDNITICADGQGSETVRSWCAPAEDDACLVGGTSAAAATVSAVAALMLSANPELEWRQVKEILRTTADPIDNPPKLEIGEDPAIANYDASGHSKWYGGGRLNAYKAVKAALDSVAPAH